MFENKEHIQRLQKKVGAKDDGYWGGQSQDALICSGYALDLDYDIIREELFKGSISKSQFAGLQRLLKAFNVYGRDAINPLYVSYMLATSFHETAHTMQPVAEYGKGRGKKYYQKINGHRYYGRGDVQLTWWYNYQRMGRKIGFDLYNNPSLALEPHISAKVLITGMLDGDFTGKSLSDYIKYGLDFEFKNARRIVNGTDKASLIQGYAQTFLSAIILKNELYDRGAL